MHLGFCRGGVGWKGIARKIAGIYDRILDMMTYLAGILVVCLMLFICSHIFLRFITGRVVVWWALEVSEHIMLYVTFLVCAWLLRSEEHIMMQLLVNSLKPSIQAILKVITSIVIACISWLLIWNGGKVVWEHFQLGLYVIGGLELPTYLILLVIPVGSLFLFIQSLRRIYSNIVAYKGIRKADREE